MAHQKSLENNLLGTYKPIMSTPKFKALTILILILNTITTSCALTRETGGFRTKYFIGFGKVSYPAQISPEHNICITDISTIGINIESGIGLGFFHRHIESVPEDCRVYIKVRNKEDLDRLILLISQLPKEGICAALETQ